MSCFSSGLVNNFSASEGDIPSYATLTYATGISTSGDASLGIDKNALIPEKKINTRAKITAPGLLKQPSIIDFMFYSQLILYSISSPGLTKA